MPTFPNAKYLFARRMVRAQEYQSDEFTDDPYYEDSILPVIEAGAAELVDGTHVIDDWVRLVIPHLVTRRGMSVSISGVSYQDAVMSGDLMHHPLQCAEPDWNSCFCVTPS